MHASDLEKHAAYHRRPTYGRSVVAGINKGYFRRQIAEASYRFSEECEAGDRIIVGVNAFTEGSDDRPIDILQIPHTVETDQCDRLAKFKQRRDAAAVKQALYRIRETARARRRIPGSPRAQQVQPHAGAGARGAVQLHAGGDGAGDGGCVWAVHGRAGVVDCDPCETSHRPSRRCAPIEGTRLPALSMASERRAQEQVLSFRGILAR